MMVEWGSVHLDLQAPSDLNPSSLLATPFDNDDNVEYDFEAMTKLKNARICSQSVKCILLRKHFLELDKKVTW